MSLRYTGYPVLFFALVFVSCPSNADKQDGTVSQLSSVVDNFISYRMGLIEDYGTALNDFKDYRENCKNSSSSSSGKLWNGARGFCSNEKLSGLQSRLKNLGNRFDSSIANKSKEITSRIDQAIEKKRQSKQAAQTGCDGDQEKNCNAVSLAESEIISLERISEMLHQDDKRVNTFVNQLHLLNDTEVNFPKFMRPDSHETA